jgi:dihydroorotate dehydrogenase (NAD+) catalytic subunit
MPIVGMGGVRTGVDALELVAVGARHVAIGTTLFSDPDAPTRIRMELHAAAHERGWNTYEDAYAAAHEESLSMRTT